MQRFLRPSWSVLLAAPLALVSAVAHAQGTPAPWGAQPIPQDAPPVAPAPWGAQPIPAPYAQPTPAPVADTVERAVPGNWYGWQTLIAVAPFDIAMFVGLARSGTTAGNAALATGFIGHSLAPSVVHWAHGRVGTGFGSIGLHAGTAAAGLVVGYAIGIATQKPCPPLDPCRNNFLTIPVTPVLGGAIGGMIAGTVLDTIFFTYRQRLTWTASAEPEKPTWGISPYATTKTAGLAAGGTF